tara:strand:- start:178 stop:576 length:399 start_codon:yes stop_codon:yes gene_type:complete
MKKDFKFRVWITNAEKNIFGRWDFSNIDRYKVKVTIMDESGNKESITERYVEIDEIQNVIKDLKEQLVAKYWTPTKSIIKDISFNTSTYTLRGTGYENIHASVRNDVVIDKLLKHRNEIRTFLDSVETLASN